ncbi:nucleoporin NDC1 isoform X1 [Lepisosteus oculatus]|uniref:nucleoporin NDC1 isoform X1 n=1 Tax=Lepisosteus oculatus TaxID=7918 RepID=UPI0037162E6D
MLSFGQDHWFIRKVICWRAAASIAWSVLLLPVITALFVFLSHLDLFHPVQWISDSLSVLGGSYVIFSVVLLCLVVLVVGFFDLQYYTVVPSIPCTKIALIGKVLHPQQFIHSLAHCLMGLLVSWCAAVMIGGRYQVFAKPCHSEESHQMCLNEYHLFFLLAGAFMGYSYSLLSVVKNMNYVSFQTIQQYKYLRFKGTLPVVIKHSAVQSLYSVRNYCITYLFLGYIPRAWICTTMNLSRDSTLHALDTLAGLLDFSLMFHLWITGTFLLVMWYITWLLFRIYITEMYWFPVQTTFSENASQCLPKVLTGQQPPVLKFLALQDLALLSQNSPSRRQEVFSLSQPGGHPHNWTAISGECLGLLSDLTRRLVAYHEAVASNGRVKQQSAGSDKKSSSSSSSSSSSEPSGLGELAGWPVQTPRAGAGLRTPGSVLARSSLGGLRSPLTAPFTPDLGSPFGSPAIQRFARTLDPASPWYGSVQSPHVMRRGPKLWTSSTDTLANGSPAVSPAPEPRASPAEHKPSFFSLWLQNRREQVKTFLAKRVLVMYLFNKLPEASSQALFADSQAHIWALEGLSNLVAASYTEDRFGVVQTTFPNILSTMLTLLEAVDKHFKLPHASSKPVQSSGSLEDTTYKTLRFALRASLKTAIYRITVTFGEHLNAVEVSAEHRKRLQQFMEYKE